MDTLIFIFILSFILIGGTIFIAIIWKKRSGHGYIKVGRAELKFEFDDSIQPQQTKKLPVRQQPPKGNQLKQPPATKSYGQKPRSIANRQGQRQATEKRNRNRKSKWKSGKKYHLNSKQKQNGRTASQQYWLEVKGKTKQFPLDTKKPARLSSDGYQASVYWQTDRFKIRNSAPHIPIYVNNQTITEQNLGDGNTIRLGRVEVIFRDGRKQK